MAFATIEQIGEPAHIESEKEKAERLATDRKEKRATIEAGLKRMKENNG